MLCDHQVVTDHLIDYIDGKLSPVMRKQVEDAMAECPSCKEAYLNAVALTQTAARWQDQPVPEWHRTEYAVRPRQQTSSWLNWTSLAASAMAILMVVFQVNISTSENGLQIAFGSQANVDAIVERKLAEYKQQQDTLLDARFVAAADKQDTARKLMMADMLDKTREERRDDLNFIVTGIQTQRFEDQAKLDKELLSLAQNQIENNQYISQLIQSANYSEGDK
ncbi:hypothetical protein FLL45_15585 [Aliikangiella marina]|uniref:Putative zinc-finger domain-containing protein n=1 Tax=Aliikangiella marina TaxID=1712262 RepID=A0A545T6P0_9GAMM|nr:zf-HC2 domain-containing protein [Aliikangiella marina]TQV72886.1 hypothetical protein FLL45_15585 [Aliikangiella marina]